MIEDSKIKDAVELYCRVLAELTLRSCGGPSRHDTANVLTSTLLIREQLCDLSNSVYVNVVE